MIKILTFQRVIRQRKCTKQIDTKHMARSIKTVYAVDTVKQWRDLLKNINEERNEQCNNRRTFTLLQGQVFSKSAKIRSHD